LFEELFLAMTQHQLGITDDPASARHDGRSGIAATPRSCALFEELFLATLTKSEKLQATQEGSRPWDLAFLAMTQHQLGMTDEAKATLGRLREFLKQPGWAGIVESQELLREAEELIEGKGK
jgi:hypothetical protein